MLYHLKLLLRQSPPVKRQIIAYVRTSGSSVCEEPDWLSLFHELFTTTKGTTP